MNSYVLQLASRAVQGLLILLGILALLRGHNHPGGGFIGGLLMALSIVFRGFAWDNITVDLQLRFRPQHYMATGILAIILSLLPGIIQLKPAMTGIWLRLNLPLGAELKLGTPLLFDLGVFLIVMGITLQFFFALNIKHHPWK